MDADTGKLGPFAQRGLSARPHTFRTRFEPALRRIGRVRLPQLAFRLPRHAPDRPIVSGPYHDGRPVCDSNLPGAAKKSKSRFLTKCYEVISLRPLFPN